MAGYDDDDGLSDDPFQGLRQANFIIDAEGNQTFRKQNVGVTPFFYIDTVPNPAKSEEAGRPIFDEIELCRIEVAGDIHNVHVCPVDENIKRRFPRPYAAWRDTRKERLIEGTPLKAWPPIPPAKIAELAALQIYTVEALAQIPDTSLGHHMYDLREWRTKADTYLKSAADSAYVLHLAAENERQKTEIAELKQQFAAIMKRLDERDAEAARRGAAA